MNYDEANRLFKYDEETGQLLWWTRRPGVRPGLKAGFMLNGTRYVTVDGERVIAKNIVWLLNTGDWPNRTVHHLNGNRADVRFENLSLRKPKPVKQRAPGLVQIEKGRAGEYRVLFQGTAVVKDADTDKVLEVIRALLVY